jgi:hypothetical protein
VNIVTASKSQTQGQVRLTIVVASAAISAFPVVRFPISEIFIRTGGSRDLLNQEEGGGVKEDQRSRENMRSFLRAHINLRGLDGGLDFLAGHLGNILHEIGELKKEIRKLKRKK